MSIIPLHLQRRVEQRWAARFGSLAIPSVQTNVGLKGSPVNGAPRAAKAKEKPAGLSRIHHIAASHRTASLVLGSLIPTELQVGTPEGRVRAMLSAKQGEKHMPVGLFRSEGAWPVHGAPPLAARAGLASLRRDSL